MKNDRNKIKRRVRRFYDQNERFGGVILAGEQLYAFEGIGMEDFKIVEATRQIGDLLDVPVATLPEGISIDLLRIILAPLSKQKRRSKPSRALRYVTMKTMGSDVLVFVAHIPEEEASESPTIRDLLYLAR